MKLLSVPSLAVACLAVVAWMTGQAGAADWANPTASSYGYGAAGNGAAGNGYGMAGYNAGNSAPDMEGYPGNGYNGYSYAGYGSGGYGYGGYGYGGSGYGGYVGQGIGGYGGCGPCARRRHCCSFGGNALCCTDCWDGYCGCGAEYGVKVHRRHRALGCGAGPCVDSSYSYANGYATNCGRPHRCHLRRNRAMGYCGAGGCSDCAGGTVMDTAPGQPAMSGPSPAELLQSPPPSSNSEPPSPGDDSST
jgi:hypothetical protein